MSQEARGMELSKASHATIKGNLRIITPLIFSSLERIDTIATAMGFSALEEKNALGIVIKRPEKGDYFTLFLATLFLVASLLLILQNPGTVYAK